MCAYLQEITEVVEDFVNNDKMFTAYDVTKKLRANKLRVKHDEVKQEVHKMFDAGELFAYNRTLANLSGVNPQPWIYHPLNADPSRYGNALIPRAQPIMNTISVVDDDNGTVTYKFDSTNRLCVPNKLVRQLGSKEGDNVFLVERYPVMEIYPETSPLLSGVVPVACYVVDRYDNVRIGRTKITGTAFEIDGNGQKITIKKYA